MSNQESFFFIHYALLDWNCQEFLKMLDELASGYVDVSKLINFWSDCGYRFWNKWIWKVVSDTF